jgi:hypothetical protein
MRVGWVFFVGSRFLRKSECITQVTTATKDDHREIVLHDRVIGIVSRQQVKKVGRNGQREFIAGQQNAAAFLVAQFQMFLELREGGNSIFELPSPIVPEFRSCVWPITRRVRNEGFSVPILRGKSVHFCGGRKS